MEKHFFSITEIAKMLGISRVAVFNKIKNGQIKAQKIGRVFAISEEEVKNIIGENLSEEAKKNIDQVMDKAIKDYRETFELLGKT